MKAATDQEFSQLLATVSAVQTRAADQAFPIVYAQLRILARRQLARVRSATLAPTELVHEVYLKLCEGGLSGVVERSHFLALGARAMRQILVSRARRRRAIKRDAGNFVTLTPDTPGPTQIVVDVLALDEALTALSQVDERKARAIELRAFGGMSFDEIARVLDISRATLARDYRGAQAWLYRALEMTP